VCHAPLQDPKLYSFLLLIDQDLAAQAQSAGCACGGVLHSARYPGKPRGAPRNLLDQYRSRLSFCCAACRRRTTPESVRYLGRRVYLAAVVLLVSAMRAGISGKRVAQLSGLFAVAAHPRTLAPMVARGVCRHRFLAGRPRVLCSPG